MTLLTRFFSLCLLLPALLEGQFGRRSWTTFGADPQRTGWNKTETELTPDNVKNLKMEWAVKLDRAPAVAGGRVYAVTQDGILYAFGLGIPQP